MSWDISLFNSPQKIESIEDVDESQFEPTDFCSALETYFKNVVKDGNHREIKGKDFAIEYYVYDEPVSNIMLSLYGENALYELIPLVRKYNWQIFDTSHGQMIDLENPALDSYENFQSYLQYVLKQKE